MKRWSSVLILALLLSLSVLPVQAAPAEPQSGNVHFGPYTLGVGEQASGDLVVFGGPARLEMDATLDGDLTVLGPFEMEEGATVDGELVVTGAANIAGTIEGDVFVAGAITLRETAYILGNVSAVGAVTRDEGAVVEGEVVPVDEDFEWNFPVPVPSPSVPSGGINRTPRWVSFFLRLARGVASVVVLGLLSLVAASLWPVQIERVGRVIEEAPLTAYGVGLLGLILAGLATVLLVITICLSPFAVLGLIVVGVSLLFGWIALGTVLGRRILVGLSNQSAPNPVVAAILGTVLITLILAMARVVGVFHTLLLFLLLPPAAGAVLLTRLGSRPYATQGIRQGTPPVAPPPPARTTPVVPPSVEIEREDSPRLDRDDIV